MGAYPFRTPVEYPFAFWKRVALGVPLHFQKGFEVSVYRSGPGLLSLRLSCLQPDHIADKVGREHLPFKRYRSSTTRSTTDRYFVDKFPIFASCVEPGEPAIPHFCYIDEGQHSTSRFEQYLQEYLTLLARLTRFRVIYISSSKDQFEVSRKVFERMILSPSGCVPKDPFVDRLIGFFHDRAAYENRDFTRFDQAKLIQFRADRAAFTGQQYEEMFGEWKAHGDSAVVARLCPEVLPKAGTAGEFGTYLLRFNYDLFGTLLNGRREPNTCTKATA